jgi:hypothetical protein
MNAYQASVLIHVDDPHEIDQFAALQGCLGHIEGVTQIRSSTRPKLTWVDYDPGITSGRNIFHHMQRQGMHTQLVGM